MELKQGIDWELEWRANRILEGHRQDREYPYISRYRREKNKEREFICPTTQIERIRDKQVI